jgi:uncharacterized protein (DUF2336 family)
MSLYASDGNDGASGARRLLADAASAARGERERLSAVLIDLFLADEHRPTDRQRAIMARLLKQLVREVEADLRADLFATLGDDAPVALTAALGTTRIEIAAPILARAQVLRDPGLVALLLMRAEEHRIVSGLRRMSAVDPDGAPRHATSIDSADPAGAELEMAVLIAESRRFDRAQDPTISGRDLPADIQHRLVWLVAAALREYMIGVHEMDGAVVDAAMTRAVAHSLATHDEGGGLDASAMRLARHREGMGTNTDAALYDALRAGRLALFVAMLAVRAGIDQHDAFAMVSHPGAERLAVLLRAIDVERDVAALILFDLAAVNGLQESRLADQVDDFAALRVDEAAAAVRPWQIDAGYRAAIDDVASGLSTP